MNKKEIYNYSNKTHSRNLESKIKNSFLDNIKNVQKYYSKHKSLPETILTRIKSECQKRHGNKSKVIKLFQNVLSHKNPINHVDYETTMFYFPDPKKQSPHEHYLKNTFTGLKKLSNKGDKALYLHEDGLIYKGRKSTTKSIDFKFSKGYIYAKYSNNTGGSQDDCKEILEKFIPLARKSKKLFLFVLEGTTFDKDCLNKLRKETQKDNNIYILNTDQLGYFLLNE